MRKRELPRAPDTSLIEYDTATPFQVLQLANANQENQRLFEEWIRTGSGNLQVKIGKLYFTYVYPARIDKLFPWSTQFHMYAKQVGSDLQCMLTQNIPMLVLGEQDTGQNLVYRWTNGNEFTRLESQAIYKWKNGREYMHEIMYASADERGVVYILDYATDTAVVYAPMAAAPFRIEFKPVIRVRLTKRSKIVACSICAQPALLKCLCAKAFYCTEACAAKDEKKHMHC
jgi:hypothetical protein